VSTDVATATAREIASAMIAALIAVGTPESTAYARSVQRRRDDVVRVLIGVILDGDDETSFALPVSDAAVDAAIRTERERGEDWTVLA